MVVKSSKVKVDASKVEASPDIIQGVLESIRAEVGEDGAQLLGADGLTIKIRGVISTGVATIDAAIGRGGVPLGRLTILHGAEGCLVGDTMIPTNRAGKGESFRLDHLVKMSNGGVAGGKKWDPNILTKLRALHPNGQIRLADMASAYASGTKTIYKLVTHSGKQICATADHRFITAAGDWKRLEALVAGEEILVEQSSKPIKRASRAKKRMIHQTSMLVNHPYRSCCNAKKAWDGFIVPTHRLIAEARLNGVDFAWYVATLRDADAIDELKDFVFLDPKVFHVHHMDEDSKNNEPSNLKVLTVTAHNRIHSEQHIANLASVPIADRVVSITQLGEQPVYDIEMSGPSNFVANGFVVHNCGKTTLALMIVAACQRAGGVVVYCDKEYKLDPDYAVKLGVDIDHMIWAQPPYLERFFQTSQGAIKRAAEMRKKGKRVPILLVLDSMNAAISKAQYEGEWDDQYYAPQARVFSALLPKLMPEVHREDVAMLWISQVRKKMGVIYGDGEDIAGGNAPKFYASLILHIQRLGTQKNDTGEKVSNKIRVEARKNQIAPPFKKADCQIVYGFGIDKELALLVQAEKMGLASRKSAWWSYGDLRLGQGDVAAADMLRSTPETARQIAADIKKGMGW